MRKFYLCGILMLFSSLLSVKAAPFGIKESALQKESTPKRLWDCILEGQPITLDLVLPPSQEPKRTQLEKQTRAAFNMWFTDTAKNIEKSGRAKEFADVLPILKQGLVFGRNGLEEHVFIYDDLSLLHKECYNDDKSLGCAFPENRRINLPTVEVFQKEMSRLLNTNFPTEGFFQAIAHEFGHQLGFIGQYPAETSWHMDSVVQFGYSSETYEKETVMSAARSMGKIGCADTNAVINMIDLQRNGAQGTRAGKTWKSFCPNSKDEFKDGRCVNCSVPYQIRRAGRKWGQWNIDRGTGIKNYAFNLAMLPQKIVNVKETVIDSDSKNRPLKTKTNNGEIVYYEYFQAVTRKAAFLGQELTWVETVYKDHTNNEYAHELEFWAGIPISLEWSKPSSFSYKEWKTEIRFVCKKSPDGKFDCQIEKDQLTQRNSPLFGDFAEMNPSSVEYKTAKAAAVDTLMEWFKQLPDEPLQQ